MSTCAVCKYDESGRCVECGSYKEIENEWIEVQCPNCDPIVDESFSGNAFNCTTSAFPPNTPAVRPLAAKFIFEIGGFGVVTVQCPRCNHQLAVYSQGSGFSIGAMPNFRSEIEELRGRYQRYEAFVIYDDKRLLEFKEFERNAINDPSVAGRGIVEQRIRTGTFQLLPGFRSGAHEAAVAYLKERQQQANPVKPSRRRRTMAVLERLWKKIEPKRWFVW